MSAIKSFFVIFVSLLALSSSAHGRDDTFVLESGAQRVNLVELFSSEGCSSCPPAEKRVVELRQEKSLWKSFVPIEFHVDYWNQLGWVDPFSNQSFTRRQRRYASEWGASTVFTPAFAVNGIDQRNRLSTGYRKRRDEVGNLRVTRKKNDTYTVEFKPKNKRQKNYRVFAALLGNGLQTKVPRGENAGTVLKHEFVVLSLNDKKLEGNKGQYRGEIKVSQKNQAQPKSLSLAFWVSSPGSQAPVQAVGGDLP